MSGRALALGVLLVAMVTGLGCGKHKYGQYELDSSLSRYCIEIRWGRILKAAEHVTPEMRGAFVESWSERAGKVDIQDLDVVSMAVAETGDEAAVMLRITYVDNQTLQIRSAVINQTWKRTEYGWLADDAFDLEGKRAKAAPAPATGEPATDAPATDAPATDEPATGDPGFGGG